MDEPLFKGQNRPDQISSRSEVWQGRFEPKFLLQLPCIGILRIDLCEEVIHMNGPPVQNGPTNCGSTSDEVPNQVFGHLQIVPLSKAPTNDPHDHSIGCLTQPRGILCDYANTGWMSVGELAMTPKISLVAVCCSQMTSLSSWNSRTFSMAITAWAAKVLSRQSVIGRRRTSVRRIRIVPIGISSRTNGKPIQFECLLPCGSCRGTLPQLQTAHPQYE